MFDDCDLRRDLSKTIFEFICRHHESYNRHEGDDKALTATRSELIIMALVDMRRPIGLEEINLWITKLLGTGYREHRRPGYHERPTECLFTVGDLLYHAFDLPVIEVPLEPGVDALNRSPDADSTLPEQERWRSPPSVADSMLLGPPRWTTPIRDAALSLRRRLFSPWSPKKHFPIMRLPVELREYIFKYALALPPGACMRTKEPRRDCRGGLGVRWELSAPRWHSALKQYEVDADFLALLRVSKAIYREASPCFWSQDVAVSGNAPKLCRLLRGAMGWKFVRQIDLKLRDDVDQRTLDDDDDDIASLAAMPILRKLTVRLTPLRPNRRKEGILRIPSVMSLRQHVRNLEELVIHGPLENCEDVLRAELMGPRKMLGSFQVS